MRMIDPDVKGHFIFGVHQDLFLLQCLNLKKLIDHHEIKATKRNGRYIIDAESANSWYKSLFGDETEAA